jgi:dTMP kinase
VAARGRFVTFEGGEGAGKSTQMRALAAFLEARGIDVVATREPGGSPKAERIRAALLAGEAEDLGPFAEALLFAAARIDHVRETIAPALARGAWVICDRFADSTRVYQGIAGDLDPKLVTALERTIPGELRPDLTIVLDLPAEIGLARATARRGEDGAPDRFEKESLAKHALIRDGFLAIARDEPDRCAVIDAARDEAAVAADVAGIVAARFPEVAAKR